MSLKGWGRAARRAASTVAGAVLAAGLLASGPGLSLAQDGGAAEDQAVDVKELVKKGREKLKAQEYAQAAVIFREALIKNPKWVPAHDGLGTALLKQRKWDEAIEVFKKGLEAEPKWSRGLYQLGYTYRKTGDFEQSIEFYKKYIELETEDPDAYYGLGQALSKVGRNAEAVEAFKKYVEKEKRPSEQKYVARAKELIASLEADPELMGTPPEDDGGEDGGEDQGAEAALPVPTGDPAELLRRGDLAFQEDNLTEAARYYRGAARGDDGAVAAPYKLGVVLAIQGDLPGAIGAWEKVLERDPGMTLARQNIDRARARLREQADKGVDDPRLQQDLEAQLELATGYLDAGRPAMALRVLDPLVDRHPEDGRVRLARGRSLVGLGRHDEALLDLELALAASPGEPLVLLNLGQVLARQGDNARALYFLRRYLERVDPAGRDASLEPVRKTVARLEKSASKAP